MIAKYLRDCYKFICFKFARRIIIGSGGISSHGWLEIGKDSLNVMQRDYFARYWNTDTIHAFFAEHVWEHLSEDEAEKANVNCFEFLKSGGRLQIAVPDGFHPDPEYIELVRPGGTGAGADDHKVLYNYRTLTELLKNTGFEVQLLEYWDENAKFHFNEWS